MIGKSFPELVFIRTSILALRSIPVTATLYTACRLATLRPPLPWAIEYWLFAECLFHILLYLPRRKSLQKAAVHPPLASRADRRALFDQCLSCLPDFDKFTAVWFQSTSITTIQRENYVDWLLWALFSMDRNVYDNLIDTTLEEELNEYLEKIETFTGREIETGRNASIKPMRLTLDPVVILPRPMAWYAIVATVDFVTYVSLRISGFSHYSPSLRARLFPPRPQTMLSKLSMASKIPYWYRPHRSPGKLPVVMLHGVGIGLWPYVPFFAEFIMTDPTVGILALEILPISMRITDAMLSQEQFIEQLTHILALHEITEFVVVSHSYGSVLTTNILRSSLAPRVASIILVDPVTLLLHLADVAYNFVYREPKTANQWQLWYFASRDMGISHTLSRHFFWSDNILWKEDLKGRRVGVLLSGEDQIVDTRGVWRYLTGQKVAEPTQLWRDEKEDLSVLWFPGLDHAQIFDTPERRGPLIALLKEFIVVR